MLPKGPPRFGSRRGNCGGDLGGKTQTEVEGITESSSSRSVLVQDEIFETR
jgi:hypothetical protein